MNLGSRSRGIRQRIRQAILWISLVVFPATLYYFSPYIVVDAALAAKISASALVFVALTISSLLLGRVWCGWLCPAGALQDLAIKVNERRIPNRYNFVKWFIWIPWVGLIIYSLASAQSSITIEPFYKLETGISFLQPNWYIIYFSIVALFLGLAIVLGRRAACHTICWMAPFMIVGKKSAQKLRVLQLGLVADAKKCCQCETCSSQCPMSLDVHKMVKRQQMEHAECILCGTCVDNCSRGVLKFHIK